jgi:hypothetical protein
MLLSAQGSWVNRNILSAKVLAGIGLVSYSFYLWHWPILSFANFCSGDVLPPLQSACLVGLAFMLSILSYFWVEQPARRAPRTPHTLRNYGTASVLCSIPAFIFLAVHGWPSRYPVAAMIEKASREPSNQTCLAQAGQPSPIRIAQCEPANSGKPILAIMGDSHAASLNRYVRSAAQLEEWNVAEYTKASCPQLDLVAPNYPQRRECVTFNQTALADVKGNPNIKTVLLAGYWLARFPPYSEGNRYVADGQNQSSVSIEDSWKNLQSGLTSAVAQLRGSGKRVLLAVDSPNFDFHPALIEISNVIAPRRELEGLLWRVDHTSGLTPHEKNSAEIRSEAMLKGIAQSQHVELIDLYAALCDGSKCRYALDGQSFFEDSQHLTRLGAEFAMRNYSDIWTKNPSRGVAMSQTLARR